MGLKEEIEKLHEELKEPETIEEALPIMLTAGALCVLGFHVYGSFLISDGHQDDGLKFQQIGKQMLGQIEELQTILLKRTPKSETKTKAETAEGGENHG